MQCPYCREEMSPGKMRSTGFVESLKWTPDSIKSKLKHALGFESYVFKKDENVRAHKCENCSKIIIDLLDDFNKQL